jgi:SAM-dependent methyltransferase
MLPAENVYGHRKKVEYIKRKIVSYTDPAKAGELAVLDFGCGNGSAVSFELADLGIHLTGLDFHGPSISYARAHSPRNAEFILGTPENLHRTFDIIVCADVIEHLAEPEKTLKQLRRLQKRGGFLVGAVPNGKGLFELESRLPRYVNTPQLAGYILDVFFKTRRKLLRIAPPPDPGESYVDLPYNAECGHAQFFRLRDLKRLAALADYRLTEIQGGVVLGSPAFSAHFIQYSKTLIRWNTQFADYLPLRFVSTWYFTWEAV